MTQTIIPARNPHEANATPTAAIRRLASASAAATNATNIEKSPIGTGRVTTASEPPSMAMAARNPATVSAGRSREADGIVLTGRASSQPGAPRVRGRADRRGEDAVGRDRAEAEAAAARAPARGLRA